jgi:hypothetical protein
VINGQSPKLLTNNKNINIEIASISKLNDFNTILLNDIYDTITKFDLKINNAICIDNDVSVEVNDINQRRVVHIITRNAAYPSIVKILFINCDAHIDQRLFKEISISFYDYDGSYFCKNWLTMFDTEE